MKSMGNDGEFRDKDQKWTKKFIDNEMEGFTGDRVLDICGGLGRNGDLLQRHFNKIDILDLQPDFGTIPPEKQGKLITAGLQHIGQHIHDN